jgi:hypothetical protein
VNPLSLRNLHDGLFVHQFLVVGVNSIPLGLLHRLLLKILLVDDSAIARDIAVDRDVTIEILLAMFADGDAVLVLNAHGIAAANAAAGLGMKFRPAARIDARAATRMGLPLPWFSLLILVFSAECAGPKHEQSGYRQVREIFPIHSDHPQKR